MSRLAVIVPNYNHAEYLPDALNGIVSQTRLPDDVLIVDDCSTDNSWEVILDWQRRFPNLIRAVRNEKNLGALGNQKRGLELTQSDYIYLHSADDLVEPDCFEVYTRLLDQHPQAPLVASRTVVFKENKTDAVYEAGRWCPSEGYHGPEECARELRSRFFCSGQVMYRRHALDEAGGFHYDLGNFCDWFWLHCNMLRHGMCFTPRPVTVFRLVESSFSATQDRDQQRRLKAARYLLNLLSEPRFADVLPRFAESGVILQLGDAVAHAILSEPRWWTPQMFALAYGNLHEWAEQNRRMRLQGFRVFSEPTLEEKIAPVAMQAIAKCNSRRVSNVAFYGAGTHTKTLMAQWKRLGGPAPTCILVSRKAPGQDTFEGLPVVSALEATFAPGTLVILSSMNYERDMAAVLRAAHPDVPFIALWDPSLGL